MFLACIIYINFAMNQIMFQIGEQNIVFDIKSGTKCDQNFRDIIWHSGTWTYNPDAAVVYGIKNISFAFNQNDKTFTVLFYGKNRLPLMNYEPSVSDVYWDAQLYLTARNNEYLIQEPFIRAIQQSMSFFQNPLDDIVTNFIVRYPVDSIYLIDEDLHRFDPVEYIELKKVS